MNRIEKTILESFKKHAEQSISEVMDKTNIPKGTLKKYLPILVELGFLEAYGKGRSRYYISVHSRVAVPLVAVLKSVGLVGYLAYEEGRYVFEYDKTYKGVALDALPLGQISYGSNLFMIFENLIPESDRRDSYLAKGNNLAEILLELENTHGDFDFKDKKQTYLPFLGLNEHLFMSFAKNSYGFDVPWSGVVQGKNDFHYLVKRYDRYEGFKYEQLDFAQVMGIKSDQKYFTTSEKLFDAIGSVVKVKEERIRFLEFYLFSFVIEHADLHIKNISIINIDQKKFRLSPLYDIISNGVYRGDSDELGLPLGGKKRNITLEDFYALALHLGISKLQTKKSAKKIIEIFIKEFPYYIKKSAEIEVFENLTIQKNRYAFSSFSKDLEKFYKRRVEHFRHKGFLKELGL